MFLKCFFPRTILAQRARVQKRLHREPNSSSKQSPVLPSTPPLQLHSTPSIVGATSLLSLVLMDPLSGSQGPSRFAVEMASRRASAGNLHANRHFPFIVSPSHDVSRTGEMRGRMARPATAGQRSRSSASSSPAPTPFLLHTHKVDVQVNMLRERVAVRVRCLHYFSPGLLLPQYHAHVMSRSPRSIQSLLFPLWLERESHHSAR